MILFPWPLSTHCATDRIFVFFPQTYIGLVYERRYVVICGPGFTAVGRFGCVCSHVVFRTSVCSISDATSTTSGTPRVFKSPCDVHRHSEYCDNSASAHDPISVMHMPLPRRSQVYICVHSICGHVVLCHFYCASYIGVGAKIQKVSRFNTVCIVCAHGRHSEIRGPWDVAVPKIN